MRSLKKPKNYYFFQKVSKTLSKFVPFLRKINIISEFIEKYY